MNGIKLRAWDKYNGIYWYSENYDNLAKFFTAMQELIDGENELVLEQFIGLNDKNGKEIYRGDIVKTPAKTRSVVEFDMGLFGLNHDYGTENKSMLGAWGSECNLRCLHDGYNRHIEVIGSIYSSPELLK